VLAVAPAELQPLARALARQWPPPLVGLHRLDFDDGAVTLTLALGDARDLIPRLVVGADAVFLDGFAPDRNPQLWEPTLLKAVARCARPGATLATWCTARPVRDALADAGFELQIVAGFGRKRHMLTGRYAPRWRTRRHEPAAPYGGERSALVVGGGLAGSACAHALLRRGWSVRVLDGQHMPLGASALPWGLLHPHFAADDALLARLMRAGVAATHAALARTLDTDGDHDGLTIARRSGVLQIAGDDATLAYWQQAVAAAGLPVQYVVPCDAARAAAYTGLAPRRGGLWWPQGAVVSPLRWCKALVAGSTVEQATVQRLVCDEQGWRALAADGRTLATAPVAIVAAALASPALLGSHWSRVQPVRGRIARLAPEAFAGLRAPIAGDGYVLRDPDGGAWAGATYETLLPDDAAGAPLSDAQALRSNVTHLSALLAAAPDVCATPGFDGVRCVAHDRLPLAGAVPDEAAMHAAAPGLRGAHLTDLPRLHRLHACFALGSRGLALAPLMAELIAAQIEGEPWPLMRDVAAAVDPARFALHALRRGRLQLNWQARQPPSADRS